MGHSNYMVTTQFCIVESNYIDNRWVGMAVCHYNFMDTEFWILYNIHKSWILLFWFLFNHFKMWKPFFTCRGCTETGMCHVFSNLELDPDLALVRQPFFKDDMRELKIITIGLFSKLQFRALAYYWFLFPEHFQTQLIDHQSLHPMQTKSVPRGSGYPTLICRIFF